MPGVTTRHPYRPEHVPAPVPRRPLRPPPTRPDPDPDRSGAFFTLLGIFLGIVFIIVLSSNL